MGKHWQARYTAEELEKLGARAGSLRMGDLPAPPGAHHVLEGLKGPACNLRDGRLPAMGMANEMDAVRTGQVIVVTDAAMGP